MIKSKENVPVVIQDMIDKLFDSKSPIHIRDNYKRTLLDIRDYCDLAVKTFDNQTRGSNVNVFSKKKKAV